MHEVGAPRDAGASARLSRQMIERVLTSCAQIKDGELDKVMALLRRFDSEAAREEARERADRAQPAPPRIDMAALEAELLQAA